jgi:hypothetical protein
VDEVTLSSVVERAVAPLDVLRGACLNLFARSPAVSSVLFRRDRRLALLLTLHGTAAFLLALYAPGFLFMLVPIALGAAHVASDVRYLVLRRALPLAWKRASLAACAVLIALRVAEEWRFLSRTVELETALVIAWVVAAILASSRRPRALRAWVALGATAVVGCAALANPSQARLVFLHLHNLIAVLAWAFLSPRRLRPQLLAVLAMLGAAGLLASGVLHSIPLAQRPLFGLHILQIADWLAPGLRADHGIGLATAYLFLQSVHYTIWLQLIPQEEMCAQGTLTFRMSARSALKDFGTVGSAAVLASILLVVVGALFHLHRTRNLYLSFASFHGYLELAMLMYFAVAARGAPLRPQHA